MSGQADDPFADLRTAADRAAADLYDAVIAACPGLHEPRQHRDRKPPWCEVCGRDNRGLLDRPSAMTRPRTLRDHLIRAAERAGLAWSALVLWLLPMSVRGA